MLTRLEQIIPPSSALETVSRYYDYTTPFYRLFWHGPTGALHYGFRDETTNGLRDELLNTNRFLANAAGIEHRAKILDAGCGVGGSAAWLARNYHAEVVGLTISPRQAQRAAEFVRRSEVSGQVTILVGDYLRMEFPAETFDVVWALESACYAPHKRAFVAEAHRVLRPGGRLVVGDGFLRRDPEARDREDYAKFQRGLALPGLARVDDFVGAMAEIGFRDTETWDKTHEATPSSVRLYRRCLLALPLAAALELCGVTPRLMTWNIEAGIAQYRTVRSGLIGYHVIRGIKKA